MSRKFSRRETVLIIILVLLLVVGAYYVFVHQHVSEIESKSKERIDEADTLIVIEQAKAVRLAEMERELEEIKENEGDVAELAPYDNAQKVMQTLNAALSTSDTYNLVFSPVTFTERIAIRTIDMNYTAQSYATAKSIIRRLYSSPYRCRITGVTLTPGESGDVMTGPLSVKLTIEFYEYVEAEKSKAAAQ